MQVVPAETMSIGYVQSEGISDELAALLPALWPPDLPLARICTCGTLRVEVLTRLPSGNEQAIYRPPAVALLETKGMSTAFLLLALLICQPERLASKDFLLQTLARHNSATDEQDDLQEDRAFKRLDNVVYLLRKLLYPPALFNLPTADKLRKRLVSYIRATSESGPSYKLAGLPLLWLDVTAMETSRARARLLEEHGEDGLEEWQVVYQIGMRGAFLVHEPYSGWAERMRSKVADLLWQSVQAQWKRAASREDGQEAAMQLLLDFWQGHMTNEDAFRSLVELLGKQERFQQAEACYKQLCAVLDQEGRTPQKRTQDTMAFVRTFQLQRRKPRLALASSDSFVAEGTAARVNEKPDVRILPETRHLIGREMWLAGVRRMVQTFPAKKLIVLRGPIGVGKSSELTRLARAFQEDGGLRVIWLPFPAAEWSGGPQAALDVLLATLLNECKIAPFPSQTPRQLLITAFLTHLQRHNRPTVILLDNAECLLEEDGTLAACWETFLTQFVRSLHEATFLLATKEWRGWPGRESIFVAEETFVPPLTQNESVCLLQRLGLQEVPIEHLQAVSVKMTGIPLLLEWTAKLVIDPLVLDEWECLGEYDAILEPYATQESLAARLEKVLNDPSLLGEHLANKLAPLLQRILEKHLSEEARLVLARLAVTTIPLGKPALQLLCPRPRLLKELRDASLLAAYTNRVQLLPVVALTIQQHLSSELRREAEDVVIQAYTCWLDNGNMQLQEAGSVVAELAVLLLTHSHLLDVSRLVIRYGWMSFKFGYGHRLARIAQDVLSHFDWHRTNEYECAGLVLVQMLFPLLGKPVETRKYVDFQRIRDAFLAGKMTLEPITERYVIKLLLLDGISNRQFEEAQVILDAYRSHLTGGQTISSEQHLSLIAQQAFLFGRWCDYMEGQGEHEKVRVLREQTIALYRERIALRSPQTGESPTSKDLGKQALGHYLSYLGYHLHRADQHEEALQVIDRAIDLQEQGYVYTDELATSYLDKSQMLMALGRFQEALLSDKKALTEIQRCAGAGDALSQEEIPIYRVSRGQLYLRIGRIDEAEQLLQEALPCISAQRRKYHMFAREALEEIRQWRQQAITPQHQLDWRWIERFRKLSANSTTWWLTWAGPFTEEEQHEWNRLFVLPLDDGIREQLGRLMKTSRERELDAALREQHQPRLYYPAIPIEKVRSEINDLLQLAEGIRKLEPNAIVRRLYLGAIEEDVDYLRLIEAAYERKAECFWQYNLRVFPLPTSDDLQNVLTHIRALLRRGVAQSSTREISLQLQEILSSRFHLASDVEQVEAATGSAPLRTPSYTSQTEVEPERKISAQTAKRFFEAVLSEGGYEEWQVVIDPGATSPRITQGARQIFLPEQPFTLEEIKHLLAHELAGHAARSMAGEDSLLGLLGIHTSNYLPTEEGLALYYENQGKQQNEHRVVGEGIQWMTFAVGLASGVITPPQTFLSVATFFELLTLLHSRLNYPDVEEQKAQTYARTYALSLCLRTYRGVPDLEQAGVCYLQDAVYLRGLRLIEQAVGEDRTVLERLAVGMCSLESLPDLQELGITTPSQQLGKLVTATDLDTYILSFEEEQTKQDGTI